ncbi:hypothetical protein HDR58_00380 [bacterium]|nr:hypothetical protein [bacterium]
MSWKEFWTGYKGKDITPELKDFNWGAFLLTFIWGIKHKAWITLLAIPLIWYQLPFGLNWILFTILQFYAGFKGNMWAYQVDWWMKPKDFRKTQARWAIFAVALNLIVPILALGILVKFIQKSPDNPEDFVNNTQCSVAYSKLEKEFKRVSLNTSTTTSDLSRDFAKRFKNATADNDQVKFSVNVEGKLTDIYYISFEFAEPGTVCNLEKGNCIIKSSFVLPSEVSYTNHCMFNFDSRKNIKPDNITTEAIKKGYNIFKYL